MRREEILKLPPVVREFSNYLNTINDKSPGTINEYLLDLRTFFKYMKIVFGEASISSDSDLREIDISNIDIAFIKNNVVARSICGKRDTVSINDFATRGLDGYLSGVAHVAHLSKSRSLDKLELHKADGKQHEHQNKQY